MTLLPKMESSYSSGYVMNWMWSDKWHTYMSLHYRTKKHSYCATYNHFYMHSNSCEIVPHCHLSGCVTMPFIRLCHTAIYQIVSHCHLSDCVTLPLIKLCHTTTYTHYPGICLHNTVVVVVYLFVYNFSLSLRMLI